jgi:hypothetical protein
MQEYIISLHWMTKRIELVLLTDTNKNYTSIEEGNKQPNFPIKSPKLSPMAFLFNFHLGAKASHVEIMKVQQF